MEGKSECVKVQGRNRGKEAGSLRSGVLRNAAQGRGAWNIKKGRSRRWGRGGKEATKMP